MTPPRESPHLSVRVHQITLFRTLTLGILTLLAVVTVLNALIAGVDDSTWRSLVFLALLGLAVWRLDRGHFTSSVVLVIAVVLVAGGRALMESGIAGYGASLLTFTVAVVLAGVLLGRGALLATAGVSVAWVVAVYVLEARGAAFVAWGDATDVALDSVIIYAVITAALVIILDQFGLGYKRALTATAEREEELRLATAAAPIGIWSWDVRSDEVDYSPGMKAMFGLPPDARPTVQTFLKHLHPDEREQIEAEIERARQRGSDGVIEHRIVREDGSWRWVSSYSRTIQNARGEAVRVLGVMYDVTEDRMARARLALLVEAGKIMGESLDVRETLTRVARVAVPRFADWVAVDIVLGDGTLDRVAVHHKDPDKVRFAHELSERYPSAPDAPHGVQHVLRTHQPELLADISDTILREAARDDEHYRMLASIGFSSAVVVPMLSQGRAIGALTLVYAESGQRYDRDDVAFLQQLADRAAIAVENARLFEQVRDLAGTLEQRVEERTREVQRLVAEVTTAEAKERHRIARLLHDELQQQLHAMQIMLQGVLDAARPQERGAIEEIEHVLRDASRMTRHLTTDLSPPTLEGDDFVPVVHWMSNQMKERYKLGVELDVPGALPIQDIAVRALLHALVQELLFNVVKHAGVLAARVSLARVESAEGTEVQLVVEDDGRGFDPDEVGSGSGRTGFGLSSAADRVRLFGGSLEVESEPGQGARITATVPVGDVP